MYNNVHFIPSLLAILLSAPQLTRAPLLVFVYPSTRLPLRLRPSSVVCSLLRSLHAATNSIMNLTLALPTSPAQPPHPRIRAPGSHFRILVTVLGCWRLFYFGRKIFDPVWPSWVRWRQFKHLSGGHDDRFTFQLSLCINTDLCCVGCVNTLYCSPRCVSSLQTWPGLLWGLIKSASLCCGLRVPQNNRLGCCQRRSCREK